MFELNYKLIYQNGTMCIKGSYAVASYDEDIIILKCGKDNICINGESLFISHLSPDEIYLRGSITEISFA